MPQDATVEFPKPMLFLVGAQLNLETIEQEIKEFIHVHLDTDINGLSFEVDDRIGQFMWKRRFFISQLKMCKDGLKMMQEFLLVRRIVNFNSVKEISEIDVHEELIDQ
jgi:hypothetical protein